MTTLMLFTAFLLCCKKPIFYSMFIISFLPCFLMYSFCLFIFGCVGSLLLQTGFIQLRRVGATLRCGAQVSHCGGFSCCGAWALGARGSVVVAHRLRSCGSRALELRLSSCGARAQLLRGMWDLPRPGLEPMSPALAGGFLITVPPGKPSNVFMKFSIISIAIQAFLSFFSFQSFKVSQSTMHVIDA